MLVSRSGRVDDEYVHDEYVDYDVCVYASVTSLSLRSKIEVERDWLQSMHQSGASVPVLALGS
jgi:hypothetical protein